MKFKSDLKEVTISVADEYCVYNMQGLRIGDTVLLETWRDGNDKAGWVYTINAVASDKACKRAVRSTVVTVPHDKGI